LCEKLKHIFAFLQQVKPQDSEKKELFDDVNHVNLEAILTWYRKMTLSSFNYMFKLKLYFYSQLKDFLNIILITISFH